MHPPPVWWVWLPLVLATQLCCRAEIEPAAPSFDAALFAPGDSPKPPPDGSPAWQAVSLPDAWRRSRPGEGGLAWYRFEVEPAAQLEGPFAVHLPMLNMNAAVWVNGEPIGAGGRLEEPVAHNFNRPLYFTFPPTLLSRPKNHVDVRLFAYANHYGLLGPIQVGPDALLRPGYEQRYFLQVRLAELSTVVAVLMTLFVGSLWLGARGDGTYGYFAAATFLWGVNGLNYWVREIPVAHWTWERIVHSSLEGFVVLLAIWGHRLVGLQRSRVERSLMAFLMIAVAVTWSLPTERFYPTVNALHGVSLSIGAYVVWLFVRRLGTLQRWEAVTYVAGGLACVAFAVHDLSIQFGWRAAASPFLLVYAIPFMMLAFGSTLLGRFVRSLSQAEEMSRELEQRVAAKHAELEENYERLRELEQERVIAGERERLMREVHDGLGGQLVSTLSMVEGGRGSSRDVAAALRSALDEMRLVIDSLDPSVGGLHELLGMLRSRLDPLLRRNALRFDWRVGSLPPTPSFGPEEYLNVLRIVQEAVTNVIKHAQASVIRVETQVEPGSIRIEIHDDGGGDADRAGGGRGIQNMHHRARALGGELEVAHTAEGTAVVLRLPLDQAAAD